MKLEGVYTALITPFVTLGSRQSAEPDWDSIGQLVEWQIASGVSGIVVSGTTGESATLSVEEKLEILKLIVKQVAGRVSVIVGTGSNDTRKSIEFSQAVKALGVDAALAVGPYYNKPTQEGLYQHFRALALDGGLPLILYNVPGRTSVDIRAETVARLAELDEVIGIKESSGSAERLLELAPLTGEKFSLLTGDDHLICFCMAAGGRGSISASANVIPDKIVKIVKAGLEQRTADCLKLQLEAWPIIKALFLETNPCPAKAALKIMGKIKSDEVRLPLVPVSAGTRTILQGLLAR